MNAYGNGRHARAYMPAVSERRLECMQGIKLEGECCITLARLRSTISITGRLHYPEHEDYCMVSGPGYRYLDSWSWHVDC